MRLSEFKDEKGIEVVAKLLVPIGNIASNPKNAKAKEGSMLTLASAMLLNNKKDVMEMLAILDDKDPAEYHCNAATILKDLMNVLSDKEFMELFGLQGQMSVSSGSVSENV